MSVILRGVHESSYILDGSGGTMKKVAFNMCLVMDICGLIVELLHHSAFSLEKMFLCKLNSMTMLGYSIPWPLHLFYLMIYAQPFIVPYSADLVDFSVSFFRHLQKLKLKNRRPYLRGQRVERR